MINLSRHHTALVIGFSTILFLVWLIIHGKATLTQMGTYLIAAEPPQPVDLIHALGGNPARADYAVVLHQQGYGPRLFFTGIQADPTKPTDQQRALSQGATPTAILPDISQATSTYEEALELRQILSDHPEIQSVMIISDSYHLRRAQWIFQRVIGPQPVQLHFVAIPLADTVIRPDWWASKGTRRWVLREYVKLGFYWVSY